MPSSKNVRLALPGAIDELIHDHHVPGVIGFFQAADGGNGENPLHAQAFHAVNVGAIIHLGGRNGVPSAVSGQKNHRLSGEFPKNVFIGWIAERRARRLRSRISNPSI